MKNHRLILPLGMRVLVRMIRDEERTDAGLYLPAGAKEAQDEAMFGEVIEVARDRPTSEELAENVSGVPHGAKVLFRKHAGVQVPWDDNVDFFLGEFIGRNGGHDEPFPLDGRQVLKRVLKRAAKLGVMPMCGLEFEWFNFIETPQSWADKHGVAPTPLSLISVAGCSCMSSPIGLRMRGTFSGSIRRTSASGSNERLILNCRIMRPAMSFCSEYSSVTSRSRE